MNKPFRSPMDVKVEISDRMNPSRTIRMSMKEYKDFIKEQAGALGIIEDERPKEGPKAREPQGVIFSAKLPNMAEKFAREIEKSLKSDGLNNFIKALHEDFIKNNPGTCPRCGNSENDSDANFCEICGLSIPIGKEK